ncbi:MAG: ABC transporter ATP-binding protein/permease [Lachnospiraceae bacterium]|nr:ABC transporter ATP-binding protein/permease [Lachnospiraceae bacterium]
MINKRLIGTIPEAKDKIVKNIIFQWLALVCNIVGIGMIGGLLQQLIDGRVESSSLYLTGGVVAAMIVFRYIFVMIAGKYSYLSGSMVKERLREMLYKKLLRLGAGYTKQVTTAEVTQLSAEGVEQLEIYFGKYLPQFFYSLLAPITLFVVFSFISVKTAIVLFICVPLIPGSIIAVQKFAKKLLAKYWSSYTQLGDDFLENLQGLTTLKVYDADEEQHKKMNENAEHFRKITMKVLTMQLNSVSIMDLIAYGGAALGMIVSVWEVRNGNISTGNAFFMILLAAEFFIPLRLLGSFFHIAMNGMAASDKLFRILDLEEEEEKPAMDQELSGDISVESVSFAYTPERTILKAMDLNMKPGTLTALVGESGSGKSTIAGILTGKLTGYEGNITIGGVSLCDIPEEKRMEAITLVSLSSYVFKGTVLENLRMAKESATMEEMYEVLKKVNLYDFVISQGGLSMKLTEKGSNLSGGQCQRLVLARALLHDSPIYIFDEATSNIDAESEEDIMRVIYELAKTKTVLLISHRLLNVVEADHIIVLERGGYAESGTHKALMDANGTYANLFTAQRQLEQYSKGGM